MSVQVQYTTDPVQYWTKSYAQHIANAFTAHLHASGQPQSRVIVERVAPRKFGVKLYNADTCLGWISAKPETVKNT